MRVWREIAEVRTLGGRIYASVGSFDGVHRGHRAVLAELVALAERRGGRAVAVTFEPHPEEVLRPQQAPPLLTTWEEKRDEMARLGVHAVLCLRFDRNLAATRGDEFLRALLGARGAHGEGGGLVVGHDSALGRDRALGLEGFRRLGAQEGWEVQVVPPTVVSGETVSSSLIRRLLLEGETRRAGELLGRPYSFAARIVRGDGRGRTLGFPTANLAPLEGKKLVPADGIYAAWAERGLEGFPAALSLGCRPTFGEGPRVIEAHLLDFAGELVGESLRVHLVERLREERRFASVEELQGAMGEDCRRAREVLQSPPFGRGGVGGFSWPGPGGSASMEPCAPQREDRR